MANAKLSKPWVLIEDFTERLRASVAERFPFEEGEDFEAWTARARLENIGKRALLAATITKISKEMRAEQGQRKRAWIAAARLEFEPGGRKACFVCGEFKAIAQAHHFVPLAKQFDLGYQPALHEYEWLSTAPPI